MEHTFELVHKVFVIRQVGRNVAISRLVPSLASPCRNWKEWPRYRRDGATRGWRSWWCVSRCLTPSPSSCTSSRCSLAVSLGPSRSPSCRHVTWSLFSSRYLLMTLAWHNRARHNSYCYIVITCWSNKSIYVVLKQMMHKDVVSVGSSLSNTVKTWLHFSHLSPTCYRLTTENMNNKSCCLNARTNIAIMATGGGRRRRQRNGT